jgi:hypothetical protein
MVKAFHKKFEFGSSERYRLFLKKHLLKLNPRYYSIAYYRRVGTTSGEMFALKIVQELQNPGLEPIAECWINDQYVYVWRDQCWMVATDERGRQVLKEEGPENEVRVSLGVSGQLGRRKFDIAPSPCNKTLLLHKVGTESV